MRFPWDRPVDEAHLPSHWFGRMLTSLYFSTFMIRASFAIMLIAFPIYILGLKSYFLFGLVLASSPLFELITVIGLGAYIDKHGRKNVLLLGLLTGSVALFGLLLTKDPVPLFIINAFHGMSAAAILVASLALIADYAPRESRGKIMGAFDFVNLFGWIVGFGVGGLLIDLYHDDIGMTFVVAGVLGLIAWAWATVNVIEPHRAAHLANEISFKMIASVLKQRSVVLLIAPWFIIYLLVSTMLTFTSKAGTQELGLSGTDLAVLLGGGGTIFLVTQVVYGWMSDKYGRTKIMIVGTVGIVGIMLTVGGVFLTAPATIAPAAHTLLPANFDADGDSEFLLQSDAGVYLLDADGTLVRELGPPEGGFGTIVSLAGDPTHGSVVSFTTDAVQIISLDEASVTWVHAVSEPRFVRALDADGDGILEVLYADEAGLHADGPSVPVGLIAFPTLGGAEEVLDLAWQSAGGWVLLLVETGNGTVLRAASPNGTASVSLPSGFSRIVPEIGAPRLAAHPPAVFGSSGLATLNLSAGALLQTFAVPSGVLAAWVPQWAPSWQGPPPAGGLFVPHLVAYGPSGNGAMVLQSGDRELAAPSFLTLGSGAALISFAPGSEGDESARAVRFHSNGTLELLTVDFKLGAAVPVTREGTAEVQVKRETAQATFGKLTSPALLVPLGIFGLMAGAFGPAALAGLTDVSQSDKRGTTMGLYSVVISTSMIVGPITTGFLVDNYGGFGVMMFLVLSAAAMAIFMAIRALDVRRQGGEEHMLEMAREKEAAASAEDEKTDAAARAEEK